MEMTEKFAEIECFWFISIYIPEIWNEHELNCKIIPTMLDFIHALKII